MSAWLVVLHGIHSDREEEYAGVLRDGVGSMKWNGFEAVNSTHSVETGSVEFLIVVVPAGGLMKVSLRPHWA